MAHAGMSQVRALFGAQLGLRVVFFAIAMLILLGDLDRFLQMLGLGAIYDSAFGLLEDALKHATITLVLLTVVKGFMEAFSSIEVSIVFANANLGALLAGVRDMVDTLFRFFLSTTALVTVQIGFLSVLQLSGMKLFLGGGTLLLAMNPSRASTFGRLGLLGVVLALVLCVLFPLLIASVGSTLNQYQVNAAIASGENLGVMREQFSDISMRDLVRTEGMSQARDTFQLGVRQVWESALTLFVSYVMMFIFLPILSLGICYVIIRQVMAGTLGYDSQVASSDRAIGDMLSWVKHGKQQSAEPANAGATTEGEREK